MKRGARAHIAHGPVSQPVEPGSLRAQLPVDAPEQPEAFDAVPFLDLLRDGYGQEWKIQERTPAPR